MVSARVNQTVTQTVTQIGDYTFEVGDITRTLMNDYAALVRPAQAKVAADGATLDSTGVESMTSFSDEIADGAVRKVDLNGAAIAVVRIGDDVYAISDVCSHANVSLSDGEVWCDEFELECPSTGTNSFSGVAL